MIIQKENHNKVIKQIVGKKIILFIIIPHKGQKEQKGYWKKKNFKLKLNFNKRRESVNKINLDKLTSFQTLK